MVGEILGRYRLVETIGSGGMGVVYRARDLRLERDVALKVLPAGALADDQARRRFRREALALSQLNHPNVATVHDFDTHEGVDFLVLEHVEGETLDAVLARAPLAERDVVALGMQLADGLEAAHQRGVVHRDLKPGNLRVTPERRLKILDFGIARLLPGAADHGTLLSATDAGQLPGTLPYMAPEQLKGDAADARSDLYAAGAVLYEMVTGRRPFAQAEHAPLMYAIVHEAPAPPSAVNARVSAGLEGVILKALEKDPGLRHQSARELRVDLERLATTDTAVVGPRARRAKARAAWLATGLAAVLAGAVLALAILLPGGLRDRLAGTRSVDRFSLAVLPFENLSPDPGQEYFADGMTEELITELAKIGTLTVISHTSVMGYRARPKPVQDVGRELRVGSLVMGSVLLSGERVRINARLVRVATGQALWAESFERNLSDVIGLQRDLALAVAREIRARLTSGERSRLTEAASVDPAAYRAYLKGRYHLNRFTEEDAQRAHEFFEQAIRIDPTFAPAHAGMADRYYGVSSVWMPPDEAMPRARAAALKAIELDGTLAEGHVVLATVKAVYDRDWAGAEREFQRALALNPGYALGHLRYAYILSMMGRHEEAIAASGRAVERDPLSTLTATYEAMFYGLARRYEEAVQRYADVISQDSSFYLPYIFLGMTLAEQGAWDRAVRAMETGTRLNDNPQGLAQKAYVYARAGRRRDALELLEVVKQRAEGSFYPAYDVAAVHVALHEPGPAFVLLDRAFEERSEALLWAKADPRFDPVRADPRFVTLLGRLGLSR